MKKLIGIVCMSLVFTLGAAFIVIPHITLEKSQAFSGWTNQLKLDFGSQLTLGPVVTSTWVTEEAAAGKRFPTLSNRNLAIDTNGHLHLTYGGNHLFYAYYNGEAWLLETVDANRQVGSFATIAVDGAGHPHISYYDAWSGDLKYARQTTAGWQIQIVDREGDVGQYAAIALDSSDRPHISYYDGSHNNLKYSYWTDLGWVIQTIDYTNSVCGHISLTLSLTDDPHISYCGASRLKYARRIDNDWFIETVDTADINENQTVAGMFTSIGLDSLNRPYIGYYNYGKIEIRNAALRSPSDQKPKLGEPPPLDSWTLKYAQKMDGGWQIEQIDQFNVHGQASVSLTIDSNDQPHLAYTHLEHSPGLETQLKHAVKNNDNWLIQTIVWKPGDSYVSIALDSNDIVHISHKEDRSHYQLTHFYQTTNGWVEEIVDAESDPSSSLSLAVDSNNHIHISHYDYWQKAIKYTYQIDDHWQTDDIDHIVEYEYSGLGQKTFLLDQTDKPHVIYGVKSPYKVKYAHLEGKQWFVEDFSITGIRSGLF